MLVFRSRGRKQCCLIASLSPVGSLAGAERADDSAMRLSPCVLQKDSAVCGPPADMGGTS